MIEAGWFALDLELGPKIYQDRIRIFAQVDEIDFGDSDDDYSELIKWYKNLAPEEEIEDNESINKFVDMLSMSEWQMLMIDDSPPLFIRKSENVNGFNIEYRLYIILGTDQNFFTISELYQARSDS